MPIYSASDVMLITPLRDGMNLVAKEYVACRADGTGVLILSERAGAASELGEALIVNPNDTPAVARTLQTALEMPRQCGGDLGQLRNAHLLVPATLLLEKQEAGAVHAVQGDDGAGRQIAPFQGPQQRPDSAQEPIAGLPAVSRLEGPERREIEREDAQPPALHPHPQLVDVQLVGIEPGDPVVEGALEAQEAGPHPARLVRGRWQRPAGLHERLHRGASFSSPRAAKILRTRPRSSSCEKGLVM